MKGPEGYEAPRGSVDLRSARGADEHRRGTVTIAETTGHDAETVGHDQPKCAVIISRNVRSRSRNRRSRWAEIRNWVHAVDLTTLDKCNGSYVSDDLRDRQDDLVWRVRRGDEVAYVYLLLEFQSSADPWMALRLMVYMGLLYQDLIKAGEASSPGRLPAVFPIVIYNGDPAWTARRDVAELIEPLPGGLTAYRPSLRYHLLDEGRVQTLAADNTVADLIEIESAAEREQMQTVVDRLSKRLAGPQNTELRDRKSVV